jgi:hypothetical protein
VTALTSNQHLLARSFQRRMGTGAGSLLRRGVRSGTTPHSPTHDAAPGIR